MMERGRKGRLTLFLVEAHFLPEGGRAFYCLFKLFEQFFGRIFTHNSKGTRKLLQAELADKSEGDCFP